MIKKPKPQAITASMVADSPYLYDALVPKEHLLRQVKERVDFSFVHDLVKDCYSADQGRPAKAPEVIAKVTYLQFEHNLSDREVEESCAQRLDFKFFLDLPVESGAPCDATTLCKLRKLWGAAGFQKIFEESVRQAHEAGVVGTKRIVDSSKTLMNAAVLKASQLLARLCERVLEGLKDVLPGDRLSVLTSEDASLRTDTSWWLSSELKEKHYLRWGSHAESLVKFAREFLKSPGECAALGNWEKQREKLERATALLEKHLSDAATEAQMKSGGRKDKLVSDVDPDARNQADHKKRVRAGYKTHVSMDQESEIITGIAVTPMNAEDGPQLLPLLEDEQERGLEVTEVAADTAYSDGPIRAGLQGDEETPEIVAYIPEPKPKPSGDGKFTTDQFQYEAERKTVTCPAGEVSANGKENKKKNGFNFYFPKATCVACPLREQCLSKGELAAGVKHGRTVYINPYRELHDLAKRLQKTKQHKQAMNERLAVEHKQGEMLNRHGLRHARYRGLSKIKIQAYMTGAVVNLKRLMKLLTQQTREAITRTEGGVCLQT